MELLWLYDNGLSIILPCMFGAMLTWSGAYPWGSGGLSWVGAVGASAPRVTRGAPKKKKKERKGKEKEEKRRKERKKKEKDKST